MKITFIVYKGQPALQTLRINTILKESVRYFWRVIWNNIPVEIRSIKIYEKLEIRNQKMKTVYVDYVKRM